jgi:hypothetical protein
MGTGFLIGADTLSAATSSAAWASKAVALPEWGIPTHVQHQSDGTMEIQRQATNRRVKSDSPNTRLSGIPNNH